MFPTAPANLLYRLQIFDLAIGKHRMRIQQIDTALGQNARIVAARAALANAEAALSTHQTQARDLDLEIKSLAEKIGVTDERLYSGVVTNPKELTEMQTENSTLQKQHVKLENANIEAMVGVEQAQNSVKSAKKALADALAAFAETEATLKAEKQQLQAEIAAQIVKRKAAAATIDPNDLARYEALRPKKRGTAVAVMLDGSCTICGVEQTSTIAQQVRAGRQLVTCASCGRILTMP